MKKEEHRTYLQMCKMQQTKKQHTGTEQCAAYVINYLTYQGPSKNTCTDTWINPLSVTSVVKAFTLSLSSATIKWYIGQSVPISAWHRTVAAVS